MTRYWAAFWVVGTLYGSLFMMNVLALRAVGPLELGFIRYGIAGLGLLVVLFWRGRLPVLNPRMLFNLMILAIGNHAIAFGLVIWAQTRIDSGLASVFMATSPLFSLIAAHVLFADERMSLQKLVGILLGFNGIIILASRNFNGGGDDSLLPELAILVAAASTALTTVYSRHVMRVQLDWQVVAAGTSVISSLIMLAGSLSLQVLSTGTGPQVFLHISLTAWLIILVIGLVNTLIANSLYYYVITGLGGARATLVTYVFPPISLALGAIFLHEVIDARIVLGTLVILAGLAIANVRARPVRIARQHV